MSLKFVFLSLFSLSLVSCASKHTMMKGTVALKVNETKGIACLFGKEPKEGDKLILFTNDCTSVSGKSGTAHCRMVKGGDATITKMLNDHYAEFEVSSGTSFSEGSILDLQK